MRATDLKRKLVHGLLKPLEIFYTGFIRVTLFAIGYRRIQIGRCSFWGPPFFRNLASDAFALLCSLDPELCNDLKTSGALFWYSPTKLVASGYSGTFGITNQLLQREEVGIVGRLVWAHYKSGVFKGNFFFPSERDFVRTQNARVKEKTERWLQKHRFPTDLLDLISSH